MLLLSVLRILNTMLWKHCSWIQDSITILKTYFGALSSNLPCFDMSPSDFDDALMSHDAEICRDSRWR